MKRLWLMIISVVGIAMLSGCLYPQEELKKNQVPDDLQLEVVQQAVTDFQKQNNGRLPIKTRDSDTPTFIKYPIDFKKLKQNGFLASTPGNAYEEGGYFQYVILDPENEANVKLVDLRFAEKLRELNFQIEIYRNENLYPPFGEKITNEVYKVNAEKLGLEHPPVVKSPYSGSNLPVVMDSNGKLFIDYRIDLFKALQEHKHNYKPGDDIRMILAEHYPIVPAYSLPYTIEKGEPVFQTNKEN
ncbi:hypothetical protein [Salinibacillus xinjiangensis]|uniref:DUF3939 domain-containing protein n=1 Tax=Salinibacillus xinjiangensis TaxID=1229268 RepID=A0A6G1X5Y3_9BACI|nr:hypothetical protein [Salinibacillus xinjiangensis]MRG86411.1 hypothetical protein [Salinibacillus xinjiangensis]